jgi:hypothetical protein
MTTAQRNRAIKTLLEKHYGKGKVWVRGSRGTAYGWVSVYIDLDGKEDTADQRRKANELISTAGIEIGTYGYNDPGSDYGFGSKINFSFYKPYDVREKEESSASR